MKTSFFFLLIILSPLMALGQNKKTKARFKKEMDTILYCSTAMYSISPFSEADEIPDSLLIYAESNTVGGEPMDKSGWGLVWFFENKLQEKINEILQDKNYSSIKVYDSLKMYIGYVDDGTRGRIKALQFENHDGGTMRGCYRTIVLTSFSGRKIIDNNGESQGDQSFIYDIQPLLISDTAEYYLVFESMRGCSTCFYEGVNITVIKKDTAYMYAPLFYEYEKFTTSMGIDFRWYGEHNAISWDNFTQVLSYENINDDYRDENGLPGMLKGKYVFNGKFFVHVEEAIPADWKEEYLIEEE